MTTNTMAIKRGYMKETMARIDFFLANSDLIYKNAEVDPKYRINLNELRRKADEANMKIQEMNRIECEKLPLVEERKLDFEGYMKRMSEKFPELADPRCYMHPMREVPLEHLAVLYLSNNKDAVASYMKVRSQLHPDEKFYFPVATSMDYGWKMRGIPKGGAKDAPYYGQQEVIFYYLCSLVRHILISNLNFRQSRKPLGEIVA